MAGKLFIIYYDSPTSTDASGRVRPFTKSDVCWFGTDEHMALQQYRSYARGGGSNLVHIKSIDLDKLEGEPECSMPSDSSHHCVRLLSVTS